MPNVVALHVDGLDGLLREVVLTTLIMQELLTLGHLGLEARLVEHLVLGKKNECANEGMHDSQRDERREVNTVRIA